MSIRSFVKFFFLGFICFVAFLLIAVKAMGLSPETMVSECADRGKFDTWLTHEPPVALCGDGTVVAVKR